MNSQLSNLEVKRLYREVLKTSKYFTWPNEQGRQWGRVLSENARKEFEQSRNLMDTEEIARKLVVGWECIGKIKNQLVEKEKELEKHVDETRNA